MFEGCDKSLPSFRFNYFHSQKCIKICGPVIIHCILYHLSLSNNLVPLQMLTNRPVSILRDSVLSNKFKHCTVEYYRSASECRSIEQQVEKKL